MTPDVDLIVAPRWIAPVAPDDRVLEDHVLVSAQGRIVELMPAAQARRNWPDAPWLSRPDHLLIPGLVNCHTHAAMTLLRGLADDLPLMEWLKDHVWPAESRWVSADFVRDGTELAAMEMIASGTTCFQDMYFFPDAAAASATHTGIRATISMIVVGFPSAWAATPAEYLEKGLALRDELKSDPLLRFSFGPHAPYTVDDESFSQIRTLSDELGLPVHMHVHETAGEVQDSVDKSGRRPFERLDELGLVGPNLVAVHMTQTNEAEIDRLATQRSSVVHCAESNLKLASGFCPVHQLLQAGVNVALGTDGAASNNDLDMIGEMRSAALLAKGVAGDASAMPADTALRMATLNGARALGLDGEIGSLEPGKSADMVCIDLGGLATQPVYDPVSQLVYAATRDQVSDVWVAGRALYQDHRFTRLEPERIIQKAAEWGRRIQDQDSGRAAEA